MAMVSEVDKCYLCDLLGDFEEFKDIKKQFDAHHECWNQNESKKENNFKTQNDQIMKSVHNAVISPNEENEVSDERAEVENPKNISKQQKIVENESVHEGKIMKSFKCEHCIKHFRWKRTNIM